jgi:hypothetical protein
MTAVQEDFLVDKVLNQYPTPIAYNCKALFDDNSDLAFETVNAAFDSIWYFAGAVAAAQYLKTGVSSLKADLQANIP